MTNNSNMPLDSASIAALWTTYLNDSMALTVLKHCVKNVEDEDIRAILNEASDICSKHIQAVGPMLKKADIALPMGFSDSDVNLKAPRLFTDIFYLFYLANMSNYGMTNYSNALYHAVRPDVREFYLNILTEIINFYYKLSDLMLQKGIFIKAPTVAATKSTDIVDKKDFFSGIFTQPRSLLLTEVFYVFSNLLTCLAGRALMQGFSQTAQVGEVRKLMRKGDKMLAHHIEVFSDILKSEGVPVPSASDMSVTDSTLPAFSDRLMLFHTALVTLVNIKNYTEAMSNSMRNDLRTAFVRLSAEAAEFASEGMDILINNGWFEQPPQVVNRDKLLGIK
jgi:spore coat protein CotF